jgi:hypothetical protein
MSRYIYISEEYYRSEGVQILPHVSVLSWIHFLTQANSQAPIQQGTGQIILTGSTLSWNRRD